MQLHQEQSQIMHIFKLFSVIAFKTEERALDIRQNFVQLVS
jgi:hypothetical protein